jgi:quinol monooxygenase YgiN
MKYIVTVRGMLKDPNNAQQVHDATVAAVSPTGRSMGNTAHQTFLNAQNPNEFFAVDVWTNMEAIQKLYSDPNLATEFGKLFEGQPTVTVWTNTGWLSFWDE